MPLVDRFYSMLGRLVARHRWPVIAAWFALAALMTLLAPSIDQVASSDVRDLLPADAPFARAEALLKATFPDQFVESSAVIGIELASGSIRDAAPWDFLVRLTDWLENEERPGNVTSVLSPAGGIPLLGDMLIADDEQMAIIMVNFDTDPQDPATIEALGSFRAYLAQGAPPGVSAYLTGTAPVVNGYIEATMTSVDRTTGVTLFLVILILLLVYRSPVSPVIPLLTVSVAYLISRGIVAWLGISVMNISSYAHVMLIVVLFGAGTDYCLLLISRYREELAGQPNARAGKAPAAGRMIRRVGETISSSAGTVIVGFASMAFAEMGLFRTTGPALAIGVVTVLLAGLTLTPALLAVLGSRAFWPRRRLRRAPGRFYEGLSTFVTRRPLLTVLVIIAALSPLVLYATGQPITYDLLADLPTDNDARAGFSALEAHMGGGQMQPVNVVIRNLTPERALAEIERWSARLRAVEGVSDVRSLSDPLGHAATSLTGLTRMDRQLAIAAEALAAVAENGLDPAQLTPATITAALKTLPLLREYLDHLAAVYPSLAESQDLAALRTGLNGLPAAALTGRLPAALAALQAHLTNLATATAELEPAYYLPEALPLELVEALGGDLLTTVRARYLNPDRTAANFELILEGNPFGDAAMDTIVTLRGMLPEGNEAISGMPASIADLRATMQRDTLRSVAIVLLGIFLVLLFLLRALVAPIYMILSILLGYAASMGVTRLVSGLLLGTEVLTWWAPFFMFVILVALGIDYNIFLMGRVREEARRHGTTEGVRRAIIAVGAIIASAGVIMAGTFSAMTTSVITGLIQLGLAVAVGVLLEVFVIQAALVPAIAVLLGRWNWWPGRMQRDERHPAPIRARRGTSATRQ